MTRTLVVDGALARCRLREWLYAHRIQRREIRDDAFSTTDESTFMIEASGDEFAEAEAYARKVMG